MRLAVPLFIVFRDKCPPNRGADTENLEIVAENEFGRRLVHARARFDHDALLVAGGETHRAVNTASSQFFIRWTGKGRVASRVHAADEAAVPAQRHQLTRARDRQRPNRDLAGNRKDCRVDTDAQRQGEHDSHREGRRTDQIAKRAA